jgi:PIN domain nuclease of toxin-antitoxin system
VHLLLDTNVFLWWVTDDATLHATARDEITRAEGVVVSAASAWEIAIKKGIGKLRAPADLEAELDRHAFLPLAVTFKHAQVAETLPWHHKDPFDRMLVAQARVEGLTLVTRDRRLALYGVATLAA